MSLQIAPRLFIQFVSTLVISALLLSSGCTQKPDSQTGPFNKESTGEEVTQGLDLTGKTVLITGANSGLGYETMRVLAMRGAHIIASHGIWKKQKKPVTVSKVRRHLWRVS